MRGAITCGPGPTRPADLSSQYPEAYEPSVPQGVTQAARAPGQSGAIRVSAPKARGPSVPPAAAPEVSTPPATVSTPGNHGPLVSAPAVWREALLLAYSLLAHICEAIAMDSLRAGLPAESPGVSFAGRDRLPARCRGSAFL